MAFSLLGNAIANGAGSATTTPAQNTTGAKLIVLAVTSGAIPGVPTDSMGNVWSIGPTIRLSSPTNTVALFFCVNPLTNAAHTFTMGFSLSTLGVSWWTCPNTPQRDGRVSAANTGTPGSVTPSANGALVITACSVGGGSGGAANAVTGGFAILNQQANVGGVFGLSHAWLAQTTAAAAAPVWTITSGAGQGAAALLAFIEVVPAVGTAGDVLLVGGGGGGGVGLATSGAAGSGGGGGGGVLTVALNTWPIGPQAVVVGAGGAAATKGSDSSFAGNIAVGGGSGGSWAAPSTGTPGGAGGSGGGGSAASLGGSPPAGGAPTAGQGSPGGAGTFDATAPVGGGGGGAAEDGFPGITSFGGKGGNGIVNTYSGAVVRYGGGGGGTYWQTGTDGPGGVGGGGAGNHTTGVAGTANTGGGGGGGYTAGAAGGSGIVIIRYLTGTVLASGGTITTSGGFTIHTFTANGTFTILSLNAQSGFSFSSIANLTRGGVSFAGQSSLNLLATADLSPGFRPPGFLLPSGYETLEDNAGASVPGGLVWTYQAGTTTPAPTYTDSTLTVVNSNPIVCDAAGRWIAWVPIGTAYKLVFETPAIPPAHGATMKTVDGIQVLTLPTWGPYAYNAANFTATGGGTWTVEPGDQLAYQFMLDGKRLLLNLALTNTSITGVVSVVKVSLPAGIVSAAWPQVGPALIFDNSNSIGSPGFWQVDPSTSVIYFGRADRANLAVSVNQTWIWFSGFIAIT